MLNQQRFENVLKATLVSKAENVSPSVNMFQNIKNEIELNRSVKKNMLRDKFLLLNYKKSIIPALCSTFIIIGSVFALSPDLSVSAAQSFNKFVNGYINMKSYYETPSKEELKNDLGYEAKMPNSLPGGYKLIESSISGHIDGSAPSEKMYDKKEAGAIYTKDIFSGKGVILDISKNYSSSPIFKNAQTVTIGDTPAYWVEYTTHVIPRDVYDKMSQEEKDKLYEDYNNGKKIIITVGSKIGKPLKEEQKITHSLKWKQDNVIYQLTDKSNELSYKEMSKMAKSIINLK